MSFSVTPEEEQNPAVQIDATKLEQLMNEIKSKQSLPMAILGGIISSIVAAVLWAIVTYATGYQIGFMAIGVGILVGFAVNFFGKGMTLPFGIVGAAFALFGCILGNILTTIIAASFQEGIPASEIFAAFIAKPSITIEIMKETFSPIDLLFYGIAIYEGYRFSLRQITAEELESLRKVQTPPTDQTQGT